MQAEGFFFCRIGRHRESHAVILDRKLELLIIHLFEGNTNSAFLLSTRLEVNSMFELMSSSCMSSASVGVSSSMRMRSDFFIQRTGGLFNNNQYRPICETASENLVKSTGLTM